MQQLKDSLLSLITRTSSELPSDIRQAMLAAMPGEPEGTLSSQGLNVIAQNVDLAVDLANPICQDTGWPTFEIVTPVGMDQKALGAQIRDSIAEATRLGKLRPNSVDSITGKNSGNNLGPGMPTIHFEQGDHAGEIEIRLLLKGGGCENKNIQYSLPADLPYLGRADRDLDGVRKCILHSVWQAQGHGCSPGALGVCIGGDRANGYAMAKQQLFRELTDTHPDLQLAALEKYICDVANTLGIGTMGFGGNTSLIGCKIGLLNRLPASYFVSVAYSCWAFRRLGVVLDASTGGILRWLYCEEGKAQAPMAAGPALARTGKEIPLITPLDEDKVRALNVGDLVLIHGQMLTARDAAHAYLMKHEAPTDLQGRILYHCGPVVLKEGQGWRMIAAGPTTSIREEPYEAEVIRRFGVRAVMGKGGMGAKTMAALRDVGAVYLNAIGGAAQYYARCIERVNGVHLLEFGIPEAMWDMEVKDFPAIVTMDSKGNSLHADVEKASGLMLEKLKDPVF